MCHSVSMLVQSPTTRDRTRNSLLIAVQELLLDPEPGALSVPQVIGRAGVSQGTFYNYFDSLGFRSIASSEGCAHTSTRTSSVGSRLEACRCPTRR